MATAVKIEPIVETKEIEAQANTLQRDSERARTKLSADEKKLAAARADLAPGPLVETERNACTVRHRPATCLEFRN